MQQNIKTHTLYVRGMHCNSCEILIEEKLKEAPGVTSVKASLARSEVVISGEFGDDIEHLAQELTPRIQEQGYTLFSEKAVSLPKQWKDFWYAIPLATVVIFGFIVLQKIGLINVVTTSQVSYPTAFLIGLIASASTCLAVVGGLVLSVSVNYAKEGSTWKPQTLFHIGRLVSFFVLGGIIGALGSSFQLGFTGNLILSTIVGVIMLILGINLLDVFHGAKRLQITLPKIFSRFTYKTSTISHAVGPLLVGVATFFLPCGFTQSMQVYTLTTGSFLSGAFTMLVFALGTLPVLALFSFGSLNIAHKPWKGIFFKTAGLIVILLALFNIFNALVGAGVIEPVFNW